MITRGNDKLGPNVWGWSIPAKKSCPGASVACLELCYGLTGRFRMPNVIEAHRRNYKISKSKDFAAWMTGVIHDNCVQVLRVHVVGDYYNPEYVKKWQQIVRANRQTKFYAYTRSWTEEGLQEPLITLGQERNFRMWFSYDCTMSVPPKPRGIRRCYLSSSDSDLPPPRKADLIFRDDQTTVLKRTEDGCLICPYDNGATPTTCSKCKLCWNTKSGPKPKPKTKKALARA